MRWNLLTLIVLLFLAPACENEEEIFPLPPTTEEAAEEAAHEPTVEVIQKEAKPSIDLKSEIFQHGQFKSTPYRILVPRNYDSTKTYPMLMFLHGVGERGTDNKRQLDIGGSFFLRDSIRNHYPSFIVYPQCPQDHYWSTDQIMEELKGLADLIQHHFSIDTARTVIGGFSMGAYGTFEITSRYPGFFGAAVAISGAADERKVPQMAKTRWRIFAGDMDDVVPSADTHKTAQALEKAGAAVSFTLFPKVKHGDTWVHAFSQPDFFRWLFNAGKYGHNPAQN